MRKNQKKKVIEKFPDNKKALVRELLNSQGDFDGKSYTGSHYLRYNGLTGTITSGTRAGIMGTMGISKEQFRAGHTQGKEIKDSIILKFRSPQQRQKFISRYGGGGGSGGGNGNAVSSTPQKAKFNLVDKGKVENKSFNQIREFIGIDLVSGAIDNTTLMDLVSRAVVRVIKKYKLSSADRIGIGITNDAGSTSYVSTPLQPVKSFEIGTLGSLIEKIITSDETFEFDETTTLDIQILKKPQKIKGGSMKGVDVLELKDKSYEFKMKHKKVYKRCITVIKNNDDLCCARAIVVGHFRNTHTKEEYEKSYIRRSQYDLQKTEAEKLHIKAGVPFGKCGFEEIKMFEEYLGVQIYVSTGDNCEEHFIYPNINDKEFEPYPMERRIYLQLEYDVDDDGNWINQHFNLINKFQLSAFFSQKAYCLECNTPCRSLKTHKCKYKCPLCQSFKCEVCDMSMAERNSLKYDFECKDCQRWFPFQSCYLNHKKPDDKGKSVCKEFFKCHKCGENVSYKYSTPETHQCGDYLCLNCNKYVRKDHKCYMKNKPVKTPSEDYIFFDFECDISGKTHKVNYCVMWGYNDEHPTLIDDTGEGCLEKVCKIMFSDDFKGYTFIAHNGRGYDFQLIMKWILSKVNDKPQIIYAGQKIMTFSILKRRFVDSLNFLTMALSQFPSTFGEKELKKGFFPYWFNNTENLNYKGKIPDKKYFARNMMTATKKEFDIWYEEQKDKPYDFMNEMATYCISDVDILRKCMIKFRQIYIDIAGIDPLQYITIAGVCMAIYQNEFILEPEKQLPPDDYLFLESGLRRCESGEWGKKEEQTYKRICSQWQMYMIRKEKKIALLSGDNNKWLRPAFFGGRTNAMKLLYEFKGTEIGRYVDITSLYPTVQFYEDYPLGHPEVIEVNDDNRIEVLEKVRNKEYFGVIHCKVKPPKGLYHPVLPTKGEKLVFDLFEKIGKWATPEIHLAIDKGYKIEEVFGVYHWKRKSNKLFRPYIKKFLKIKQECSGYPAWVKNNDDKDKYIEDYMNDMEIELDKDKIASNKGLRSTSKLCLNSLWGKFGQRDNMGMTKICNKVDEIWKIMEDERYCDVNCNVLSEDKAIVKYKYEEDHIKYSKNTNLAIAIFTTSNARCRLYKGLDKLKRQVLYFDTDSIIYKFDPNNPEHKELELGDNLGEWTDELDGGVIIGIFVSGGPKNYSYIVQYPDGSIKIITKVKGMSLNHSASQYINHNSMIEVIKNRNNKSYKAPDMVIKEGYMAELNKIGVKYEMIKRKNDHTLEGYTQDKLYGFVYDKRTILGEDENGNIDTIPFGF